MSYVLASPSNGSLGDLPAGLPSAVLFFWEVGHWYYVLTWSGPLAGWDAGQWVKGEQLCDTVANAEQGLWHAIFDWPGKNLVCFDEHVPTVHAACFNFRGSTSGLGYDFTVTIPVVGKQTVSIPLEKLAQDAGQMAAQAAWPPIQAKLEAEWPKLLQQAEGEVVKNLWPKLQPKIRAELDYGLREGTLIGAGIGGAIIAAVVGAAWWIKKGSKGARP